MGNFFRIQSIELHNFKNVKHGSIDFSNYGSQNLDFEKNITAVYGQNGSGKTALVEALLLVKRIIEGRKLRPDMENIIRKGEKTASISVTFFFNNENDTCLATYTISFERIEKGIIISNEIISSKEFANGKWNNNTEIINYSLQKNGFSISPKYVYQNLISKKELALELLVAQSLCSVENEKTNKIESISLLFSNRFSELLKRVKTKSHIEKMIAIQKTIGYISNAVNKNILVVCDTTFGGIQENIHAIPIYIKQKYNNPNGQELEAIGAIPIDIYSKTIIPAELMDVYNNFVKQINAVLPSIIPGISVELIDIQQEYNETNQQLLSFSIVTVRDNQRISLKYESAGIKKVLCIISSLIAAFNNPDMCFVVDELDSGLFEYLLGQIITVFKDDAKGQLIFTSHNLHILELLDNKSIIITTWNSDNCYRHLPNVQANNNKRLLYLKQIELSDDEGDIIYNKTNQYEMSYAFKKAYMIAKEGVGVE